MSPPYTAVIVSVPTGSVEVVSVAELFTPDPFATSVPVPIVVPPLLNVTVPLGGTYSPKNPDGAVTPVTVAVNVTGRPCGEGFGTLTTTAVVASGDTVIVTGLEVEPECVVSTDPGTYTPCLLYTSRCV